MTLFTINEIKRKLRKYNVSEADMYLMAMDGEEATYQLETDDYTLLIITHTNEINDLTTLSDLYETEISYLAITVCDNKAECEILNIVFNPTITNFSAN